MNLVEQWQKGEVAAFETLFLRYKDMVLRTALSMNVGEGEAEDIVQMAFIKVYQSRGKFEGDEAGFRRWLYRIAMNLCVDIHRKKQTCLHLEEMQEKGFEPATEFSYARQEAKDMIWQAMDCLDSKHRSVVVLRYLHGLPYEEVAKTLDIPLGTVRSRLNTAIRVMRQKLVGEKGGTYEV